MKRAVMFLSIIMVSAFLFATEVSNYFEIGLDYSVFTENADEAITDIYSIGINFSGAGYYNNNWGVYANGNLCFPSKAIVSSGGNSVTSTRDDWNNFLIYSAIFAPTYRYRLNDKSELFGALGLHIAESFLNTDYASTTNFSFGIGGDLGIRYFCSERFFFSGGCLFFHDFYGIGEVKTSYRTETKSGSYNFSSISPYIGIGFRWKTLIKKNK